MRCVSLPRLLVSSVVFLVGLAGVAIPSAKAAAQNSIPDRITAPVTNSSTSPIPNTVHPRAHLANDLGPAPADTRLDMSIRFNMSAAQQAALDQLLLDQQNPSSPLYHQWLTPSQFGAQFGLSSNDLAKVTAWLTGQGFTVTAVANGGAFIYFGGTVAQAQTAFGTSIHSLSLNGETHFANVTNISLPSAFAGVVVGVTGLHDFSPKPRLHTNTAKPQFTSDQTGNHFITPGDIYTIYNVNPLLNAGTTGAGETIAVTGQVDLYNTGTAAVPVYADVIAFRSAAGLSAVNLTTVHAYGYDPGNPICDSCSSGPNDGDLEESTIDVEWSGAMAPAANIVFVNGHYVLPYAMDWAIDNDLAPIVTTSYGLCEAGWGTTELISLNALFKQASAQGQTVLAAAGDSGATDCDSGPSATEGLTVDFPASSPYVTGMGGTQFNGDAEATGSGSTWAATQYWAGTSGSDVVSSALSYIPEAAWNDENAAAGYSFGGSGGGPSAFFGKPVWQVGTLADGARDVPDIALDADASHDYLLFCVTLPSISSCTNGFRNASGQVDGDNPVGGTSFDSQMFGGMLALIEQKNSPTKGLGNINPTLYALAGSATYYTRGSVSTPTNGLAFNDVTTGNNEMPCAAGTVNCFNGGSIGFSTGSGYDLATGWGSVNVSNLAIAWSKVTALSSGSLGANLTVTSLTPSPTSGTAGATVTLTATVCSLVLNNQQVWVCGGSAGTPTGAVQFFANNVALGSAVAVTALNGTTATATYPWVTNCSNLGQQVMSASYSGDANYQGSIGGAQLTAGGSSTNDPVTVQVANSGSCADFALTPSGTGFTISGNNASVTVAAGVTPPSVTISVAPSNGFTGTVALTTTVTTSNQSGYVPNITLSPAAVTISSSSPVATTLGISGFTQASLHLPNLPGKTAPGRTPWYAVSSGVTIASLLFLVLPRRRRLGGLLLVLLAVALAVGATGCGSSQQGPPSTTTTGTDAYSGIYVVTVNGQYSGASGQITQHIATVTYTVE
jgi:subtilase family serine protease